MKRINLMGAIFFLFCAGPIFADDVDTDMNNMESTKENPEWNNLLKEKYSLTDEQMNTLSQSGVSRPQMAMAAELSKQSGKSLDEVLKMRSEGKMGWGQIAKELGLKPGALGRSVADMHHRLHDERHERREGRHERREERREKHRSEKREKHEKKH